ncbi:FtsX-like permease family protein [Methylomarinum sp. Ch1-1]|uniref:FtsX-like permease family protein n=1 Tax=Methylomarinum roseum TaxID=3067653 RepID=A0AAU7NW19_9GAMM|nr:FtsX-like permease family protein [Methylomarinum sp. Ch1-1]MDP4522757.1 FtsX-like permease family protein [Methylomarinum sp. Ch1-1]
MSRFNLALRLLWRDARSGELTILLLALIIAVTSATAISLFADRLHRTMSNQAAEFLAADLVITSPAPIPQHWLKKARELHLQTAKTAEFSSVLIENDEMLLAGVKAVSAHYPLRGYLKTMTDDYKQETLRHSGPEIGKAWVEKRVLSALKLTLGDTLTVGEQPLTISQLITYEPDKRGDLYSLSPRVMINGADLAATHVLQPGSHVHYFFQFSGDKTSLLAFNRWVKPHLNASQRLMDIHEDRPELGAALNRAERYLGLSSIVVIVIAGVAIAMTTRRYSERHFNATAILRCLGCKQHEVLWLYICQFLALGVVASAIACILGWLAQEALFHLLRNLFPARVADPGFFAVIFGFLSGLAILFGFALPPLLRLKKVSPLRVLRRDLEPLPTSAWLIYGLALALIGVLTWRYTEDLKMTAIIIGGGLLTTLLLGLLVYTLLIQLRRLPPSLSLSWRFGLQNLTRHAQTTSSQILAFSITLVAMILSLTVRTDLLNDWQRQLPENAPNHFALNIFPNQKEDLRRQLVEQGITGSRFYPVVRGRLVKINGLPVQRIVSKDSQGERATHRDLSLTWSNALPEDNKLVAGQWWTGDKTGLVSIESKLAKSLKVGLQDELTFTIGSRQLTATVSSIRQVQWDTMKPNFYMIFSPGTLDNYANTYITSFYLPDEKKNYLNTLVKNHPGITILEVDLILKQFKSILTQLTEAINYLLYFALLAGFTVLFAAIYATLDSRIYEGALMRTLGANRTLLRKAHLLEFVSLGLLSAVLALIMSESLLLALYHFVLHIEYQPSLTQWLVTLTCGSFFIALAGYWGVRGVVKKSPMRIFREL